MNRPTDMKNLCLASKDLYAFTIPRLYRKVVLYVGGPLDHRVPALLGRENQGLRHIRKLILKPQYPFDEEHAHFTLRS